MRLQILEIILNQPNVRAVEIADKMDLDTDSVRPLIAADIAKGTIVEEQIIAPNGRPVMSFRYATAAPAAPSANDLLVNPFPARVLRALPPSERPSRAVDKPLGKPAPAEPPKPAMDPLTLALAPSRGAAQVAVDEPLEIDVPVTRRADVPLRASQAKPSGPKVYGTPSGPKTRADLALNYLHAAMGRPVTTGELAVAMGLPIHHYPTSYMQLALKTDRVRRGKDPRTWVLGPSELAKVADFTGWFGLAAPVKDEPGVEFPEAECPEAECPPVDPVSAASACVAGLADDCGCSNCATVAMLETALAESSAAEPAPAPVAVEPEPIPAPAPAPAAAPAAPALAIPRLSGADPAVLFGGVPRIKTPYMPKAPDIDISRSGVYENGEFRRSADEVLSVPRFGVRDNVSETMAFHNSDARMCSITVAANDLSGGQPLTMPPEKFVAGVMSDGSLELRVPGQPQLVLSAEHARELYLFVRTMGYAAWPTAA